MKKKRGFGGEIVDRAQTTVLTVVAAVLLVIMLAVATVYWLRSLASSIPEEERVREEAKGQMWGED